MGTPYCRAMDKITAESRASVSACVPDFEVLIQISRMGALGVARPMPT